MIAGGSSTGTCGAVASGNFSKSTQHGSGNSVPLLQSEQHLESACEEFSASSRKQNRTGEADAGIRIPTQNSNRAADSLRISQRSTRAWRGQEDTGDREISIRSGDLIVGFSCGGRKMDSKVPPPFSEMEDHAGGETMVEFLGGGDREDVSSADVETGREAVADADEAL